MANETWPALPYEEWKDTYATLHMWSQVVGKVALAQAPPMNHSWGIAMQITPRGLSTRTLPYGDRSFAIEFDFIDHALVIRVSDGTVRTLRLEPRTVADFYRAVMDMLRDLNLPVRIWPMPVEVESPIRFTDDTTHRSYDAAAANRFWHVLLNVERVLNAARCDFIGKSSPVHFFWGAFDLAATRFSGRPAPPREGPAFMREAYSHEVISHGFWPGGGSVLQPVFYAYAVPEPEGFKQAHIAPSGAYYHQALGEFVLPYDAVRMTDDPAHTLNEFVVSTYTQAANLAQWDRRALERSS